MAFLTADDFAQQMIGQIRVLDPSISCEVGTPERKIIDTVAQTLSDNQIDITGLDSALSIDTYFGTSLDRFTGLFGFQRQQSQAATGFVVFTRNTPAPAMITISIGTVLQANTSSVQGFPMQYTTTATGTIPINQVSSGYIPVQAITTGTVGNTAANTITIMVGTPVPGVTAVTNPDPLINGFDQEDDNSYKVRFKNTWARNLAGTEDQYLALAVAGAFTTKANVLGSQSRFQEYIQVPDWDDAGNLYQVEGTTTNVGGSVGKWTTALSLIPYAKEIITTSQAFVSDGQGPLSFFYRDGVDFTLNYPPVISGDVIREVATTTPGSPQTTSSNELLVLSTVGFPTSGTVLTYHSNVPTRVSYTGLSTGMFTGVPNGIVVDASTPVYLVPSVTSVQPNFTLLNVYNPVSNPAAPSGLQAVAPGQVILSEYSYVSSASRNSLDHNVTNAVDVYVDGSNDVQTSCVFLTNLNNQVFNTTPNSPWYYENYRRDGNPTKRPQIGNWHTPLFQTPLDSLPTQILIDNQIFYEGWHYWLVHEVSTLGGSIRARDGIEWDKDLLGAGDPPPALLSSHYFPTGGTNISAFPDGTAVEVDNYTFDGNIATLQASIEAARQITTDALVHKSRTRYFKLDVAVVYSSNVNATAVNSAIGTAVQAYLNNQYFGSLIQLSTLLEIIHSVSGVDNVRWSNDLLIAPDLIRVYETDIDGLPLHGASVDHFTTGDGSITESQSLFIIGQPTGTFTLSWTDGALTMTTAPIRFTDANGVPVTDAIIQTAINTAASTAGATGAYSGITVVQDVRPTTNVLQPITSFTITYGANGEVVLPSVTQSITSSSYGYDADFYLLDDELPSLPLGALSTDIGGVPGLIIRPRAQNTFARAGLN